MNQQDITKAITDALDAAVTAERERCAQIADRVCLSESGYASGVASKIGMLIRKGPGYRP